MKWLKDATTGKYSAYFDDAGDSFLTHGSISIANQDLLLKELSVRLRGDALATTGSGGTNRLGNAVALPVFDSRALALAPENALVVRFAGGQQQPGCAVTQCDYRFTWGGYAFDTVQTGAILLFDYGNVYKGGEVLVIADDAYIASRSVGHVANVLLHEVGHGLGLIHTAVRSDATNVMGLGAGRFLSDRVLSNVEDVDGREEVLVLTQNAMYHLLRHTFGWSEERLASFGGTAGNVDIDPAQLASLYAQSKLQSGLDRIYNVLLLNPSVLSEGEEGWQAALYLDSASVEELAALSYVGLRGLPFRVLASSAPGDALDLYFEYEEGSGLAGISGVSLTGGRVMRIGEDGVSSLYASYDVVGISITPVPEPASWLLFGVGGLMLALLRGRRRAA